MASQGYEKREKKNQKWCLRSYTVCDGDVQRHNERLCKVGYWSFRLHGCNSSGSESVLKVPSSPVFYPTSTLGEFDVTVSTYKHIGDYKVHEDFSFTSAKWFSVSEDQRHKVLKWFQSALPDSSLTWTGDHCNDRPATLLHNPLAVLGIPRYITDTVWQWATAPPMARQQSCISTRKQWYLYPPAVKAANHILCKVTREIMNVKHTAFTIIPARYVPIYVVVVTLKNNDFHYLA